ncbi:undecaprenyl diphosphate synthase family protein, partial [Patescibacteria group bacterium]
ITVTFALNYGGRDELVRTMNKVENNNVTSEVISSNLDTKDLPDPDLIIRPGGEMRLSGFLLWQCEYSELYFTEVLMPDFDEKEFDAALREFENRKRRFGGN